MVQYKLLLQDNHYSKWELRDATSLNNVEVENFNPSKYKLFNFDVFSLNENGETELHHSIIRNMPIIMYITFKWRKNIWKSKK